jgi:hypothetical protein
VGSFISPTVRTEIPAGICSSPTPPYKQLPGSGTITTTAGHTVLEFFGKLFLTIQNTAFGPCGDENYIFCQYVMNGVVVGGGYAQALELAVGQERTEEAFLSGFNLVGPGTHDIHVECLGIGPGFAESGTTSVIATAVPTRAIRKFARH